MENRLTWTRIHHVISEALTEADLRAKEKNCGLSRVAIIYNKLENEGLLKIEENTRETAMTPEIKQALIEYGRTLQKKGWKAAEEISKKYHDFPNFKKWSMAIKIMLRAEELIEEIPKKSGKT
jgi:hypothetical protein